MSTATGTSRPTVWSHVLRAVLSLAAIAGLLYWALWFTLFSAFRCDENCSGGQYDSWRYPAQFGLGAVGLGLGILALALGYTRLWIAYRVCLLGAALCLASWMVWVLFLGGF